MRSGRQVLVVGSYPPIPIPAAAATLDAVRRAWAAGDEVTVVSPRVSAAHLSVPVVGVLAGRRLGNLRRHTGASHAVVVMERGFPIPATAGRGVAIRVVQWQTVHGMLQAFAGFEHVTLVRVGSLDVGGRAQRRLTQAATEVIDQEVGFGTGAGGVTALGPVETLPRERPRQIAGMVGRRLLGRHAGRFRTLLASARRARPSRGAPARRPR